MESRTAHAPRFQPSFNQVYQATGYAYISVWYEWGHGGTVALLVGDENPPGFCVGALTRDNGTDFGNANGVVRPGEYWMLRCSRRDGGGFRAMGTPMYEAPSVGGDL
jgi:hypothetical protein